MSVTTVARTARRTVFVAEFTDGLLDPEREQLGPVADGGAIVANTAPGCWGPMLTPRLRGGHEVTRPVAVEGAEPGDAVAIRIEDIMVTSVAAASGYDHWVAGHYLGDPYIAGSCPDCGELYPETDLEGIGPAAIRCRGCGASVTPFRLVHGYTAVFDEGRTVGVTVDRRAAERIAREADRYAALPEGSVQHPALALAPHDLVGIAVRLRPFLGQLGTLPALRLPDSHNAGDFAAALVGAGHEFAIRPEELEARTDGHMDIDAVRAGAIVVAPVKVPGAGVYLGDMHALQGDGEIAGHTMDVSGVATLRVEVLKGRTLEGPVIFPRYDDLPPLARPLGEGERRRAEALARRWGLDGLEESAPISVVGTGPDLNAATENGLRRAARLLDLSVPEVRNRATITGAIEIGRNPGVVQVTFLAPVMSLEAAGLLDLAEEQYGLRGR
jgi:formamidase